MVLMKVKITQEEYDKYKDAVKLKQSDFVIRFAVKSGYHPARYGFYFPKLEQRSSRIYMMS